MGPILLGCVGHEVGALTPGGLDRRDERRKREIMEVGEKPQGVQHAGNEEGYNFFSHVGWADETVDLFGGEILNGREACLGLDAASNPAWINISMSIAESDQNGQACCVVLCDLNRAGWTSPDQVHFILAASRLEFEHFSSSCPVHHIPSCLASDQGQFIYNAMLNFHLSDDALESCLEPFDGILLGDLMGSANWGLASSSSGNSGTWSRPAEQMY